MAMMSEAGPQHTARRRLAWSEEERNTAAHLLSELLRTRTSAGWNMAGWGIEQIACHQGFAALIRKAELPEAIISRLVLSLPADVPDSLSALEESYERYLIDNEQVPAPSWQTIFPCLCQPHPEDALPVTMEVLGKTAQIDRWAQVAASLDEARYQRAIRFVDGHRETDLLLGVRIEGIGRTSVEAVEDAETAFNTLRGIIEFYLHRACIFLSSHPRSLARFLVAPWALALSQHGDIEPVHVLGEPPRLL